MALPPSCNRTCDGVTTMLPNEMICSRSRKPASSPLSPLPVFDVAPFYVNVAAAEVVKGRVPPCDLAGQEPGAGRGGRPRGTALAVIDVVQIVSPRLRADSPAKRDAHRAL